MSSLFDWIAPIYPGPMRPTIATFLNMFVDKDAIVYFIFSNVFQKN